jgi:hypothetical protein
MLIGSLPLPPDFCRSIREKMIAPGNQRNVVASRRKLAAQCFTDAA